MALADYVLCETCQKKLVYDGDGTIRDAFETLEIGPVYCVEHRRSPPPAVEGGWREIASAPKDGSTILLCVAGRSESVAGFFAGKWMQWFATKSDGLPARPTHWQPLPTPPAGEKGKQE